MRRTLIEKSSTVLPPILVRCPTVVGSSEPSRRVIRSRSRATCRSCSSICFLCVSTVSWASFYTINVRGAVDVLAGRIYQVLQCIVVFSDRDPLSFRGLLLLLLLLGRLLLVLRILLVLLITLVRLLVHGLCPRVGTSLVDHLDTAVPTAYGFTVPSLPLFRLAIICIFTSNKTLPLVIISLDSPS